MEFHHRPLPGCNQVVLYTELNRHMEHPKRLALFLSAWKADLLAINNKDA